MARATAAERGGRDIQFLLVACALAFAIGWSLRGDGMLTPDEGLGYALGVVGLGGMLLMLGYSLRKRLRPLRTAGPLRYWFRAHMWLGLLAPLAIAFHADFHVRSLNSLMAVVAMTLVAGSGLIGRFVYTHIHHGLYGRRATLAEQQTELRTLGEASRAGLSPLPAVAAELARFEAALLAPSPGWPATLWRLVSAPLAASAVTRRCARELAGTGDAHERARLRALVADHVAAVRRVATFSAWELLFGLWHAFHVPLFILLVLCAALHVVAVHMY